MSDTTVDATLIRRFQDLASQAAELAVSFDIQKHHMDTEGVQEIKKARRSLRNAVTAMRDSIEDQERTLNLQAHGGLQDKNGASTKQVD